MGRGLGRSYLVDAASSCSLLREETTAMTASSGNPVTTEYNYSHVKKWTSMADDAKEN